MGGQLSKRTESSTHSTSQSNSISQTTPDLSSYEDACRLDPDLRSFDSTLHDRTNRVISSLSVGVDVRSLSLDSLQEVTSCLLDMNHEVVDVILECREDIWKNKELSDLVKEYFENSLVNLDFCNALERCLKRARDSQLIVKVALQRFEEEQREISGAGAGTETNLFAKTLQELKEFRAAGDPFTDEFFAIFRSVQKQQMIMLAKLQRRKQKLDKKLRSLKTWRRVSNVMFGATFAIVLICSVVAAAIAAPPVVTALAAAAAVPLGSMGKWFNSLWKKYEIEIKGQREIVSSMQIGTYIAIKDLDNIRVLVDRFRIVIESLLQNAEFANEQEDGVVLAVGEIKKQVSEYMQTIEDLSEHANKFSRDISKARIVILQRIVKHPSSH